MDVGGKKKKKVDYEALNSSFMRVPQMDVVTARALIDIGFREYYELQGRSPEVIFEDLKKKNPKIPKETLYRLRLAVYYIETQEPDPKQLKLSVWSY